VEAFYNGSSSAEISTQITFEDGHKGALTANVAVRTMPTYPARAAKLGRAA
jgi:long-chain acyl-CoA synthetase